MGRKGKWFSSVKKAFSPDSRKKNSQKVKSKPFADEQSFVPDSSLFSTEVEDKEITSNGTSEAVVTVTEEATVSESSLNPLDGTSKNDVAAVKIQAAFRGYQARRSLRAQRGLVRLRSLVQAPPVQRQTSTALKCMQTLARVQTQIQSRRIRMSEENQALQRQLLQNRAKELASLTGEEEWNDTSQSKEELEANLLYKYEATMRREKAMAYSFTHQQTWKKSSKPTTITFMDPNNPQWGWSWLERWTMEAQKSPFDTKKATEKELKNEANGDEITKSYAHHLLNPDSKPSTLQAKTTPKKPVSSPKKPVLSPKSPSSLKSEQSNRRHSVNGALMRDDEGSGSPRSVPSYMTPTKSAKARLSPLGLENGPPEKDVVGPIKKRASPAKPRRHSGPPKVDLGPVLDQNATNSAMTEESV